SKPVDIAVFQAYLSSETKIHRRVKGIMYVEFPYLENLQAFGPLHPPALSWLRTRAIARISILLVFFAANVGTFARAETQQGPPSGGTPSRPSTWDPRPFDPSVEA